MRILPLAQCVGLLFIICLAGAEEVPSAAQGPIGEGIPGRAAEDTSPRGIQERPVVSDEYVVQPGDSLLISITGRVSFAYPQLVTPEGKLVAMIPTGEQVSAVQAAPGQMTEVLAPLGEVRVSGLTLKETRQRLGAEYVKYFKGVECAVTLLRLRTFRVFVLGQVKNAGVFWATPVDRASEVIQRAGGLAEGGSPSRIQLRRGEQVVIGVDLSRFQLGGDLAANPYVQDGDVLFVPPMVSSVTVRGAVYGSGSFRLKTSTFTVESERTSEGIYELLDGEGVTPILQKAGGVAPWANLKQAYVERTVSGTRVQIAKDLVKILGPGGQRYDPPLQDGDLLVIPLLPDQVYVQGAVTAPGAFPYQPNRMVNAYLGLAGGPTDRALLSGLAVIRANGTKISARDNPTVERGDTVLLPEQKFKWWQDYLSVASVVTSLAISWLTLTRK